MSSLRKTCVKESHDLKSRSSISRLQKKFNSTQNIPPESANEMRSEGVLFVLQAAVSILAAACCLLNQPTSAGVVEDKYSCPHGWTRYGNKKCLKYVNELQDYERAQATCRSKNQGTLVTIHSHDEQNFVYSYIHSIAASSTPIWLGAKQVSFTLCLCLNFNITSSCNVKILT